MENDQNQGPKKSLEESKTPNKSLNERAPVESIEGLYDTDKQGGRFEDTLDLEQIDNTDNYSEVN